MKAFILINFEKKKNLVIGLETLLRTNKLLTETSNLVRANWNRKYANAEHLYSLKNIFKRAPHRLQLQQFILG